MHAMSGVKIASSQVRARGGMEGENKPWRKKSWKAWEGIKGKKNHGRRDT
jgi:hypothetical protein